MLAISQESLVTSQQNRACIFSPATASLVYHHPLFQIVPCVLSEQAFTVNQPLHMGVYHHSTVESETVGLRLQVQAVMVVPAH